VLVAITLAGCADEDASVDAATTGTGGVAGSCPPDRIALADGSCFLPGVQECPQGFEPEDGGCAPILPDAPCMPGQLATVGMTRCAPLAPCGEEPWGNIPIEPNTVFVDASYVGTESGSMTQPFTNLQNAIDNAPSGALIAVAAGSYAGAVQLFQPARIWGVCTERVNLLGGADPEVGSVEIVSHGVELHDLSVTGSAFGVTAADAEALIERVRIHDTPNMGLGVFDTVGPSNITVRGSLLEKNGQTGVYLAGVTLHIEDSEIRDPQVFQGYPLAAGISMLKGVQSGVPSNLEMFGSYVHGGRGVGIVVTGSTALIEGSAVHDTFPLDGTGQDGAAVVIQTEATDPRTQAQIRGSSIRNCHEAGILAIDADLQVDSTTVREVKPQASDQGYSVGVALQQMGVVGPVSGTLAHSFVDGAAGFGVLVYDGSMVIDGSLVRGAPVSDEAQAGDGIVALTQTGGGHADIRQTRVEHWPRAGITSFGTAIVLGSSMLECNTVQLDGEPHMGRTFTFDDAGGNVCGCNGDIAACKVSTSNLQPPQAF
jgi:hypothetical protein